MSELTPTTDKKILSIPDLVEEIHREKAANKTIAHCHGVFDLVHPGHIRHLKAASREAEILVVTVTGDRFVNKGPGRPVYSDQLRAETLAALEFVNYVAINKAPSAVELITKLHPDLYVKGSDYAHAHEDVTGMITEETNAVEAGGGRVHFTDEIVMSSSELLNAYFEVFRPESQSWLNELRGQHSIDEITEVINRLQDVRVLVIGEAIIDEYFFCEGLGKSSKDPILAFKYGSNETHAGGSLSVANHLAGICGEVTLITLLGEKDRGESFIREHLNPKIDLRPLKQKSAPTIHKRRYVDTHTGSKLFELYTLEDAPLDKEIEIELTEFLEASASEYDLVVVADYGHGMLTPKVIDALVRNSPFLAVNTQANAGNRGFNTISKYPRADYICLNAGEVRLELRDRKDNIRTLMLNIAERLACGKMTVTLGREGTIHYDDKQGYFNAPALAGNVADRVGAGDAVLSATAPLAFLGIPWNIVGLIGNLAGAEAISELGTSRSLDAATLIKHVQSILK